MSGEVRLGQLKQGERSADGYCGVRLVLTPWTVQNPKLQGGSGAQPHKSVFRGNTPEVRASTNPIAESTCSSGRRTADSFRRAQLWLRCMRPAMGARQPLPHMTARGGGASAARVGAPHRVSQRRRRGVAWVSAAATSAEGVTAADASCTAGLEETAASSAVPLTQRRRSAAPLRQRSGF
eukprot:gene17023-biopygen5312